MRGVDIPHPRFCDDTPVLGTCLVIHDLQIDLGDTLIERLHDRVVCSYAMLVVTGAKCGLGDCVCVAMVSNHNVLVVTGQLNGKLNTVICMYFADWYFI